MPEVPPPDEPRSVKLRLRTPLWILLLALAAMTFFELSKQLLLDDPVSGGSRTATVIFGGIVAAAAAFWIIGRELAKRRLLSARIQEMERAERRFQSLIAGTHAGYFFIDDRGQYRQVNAAWLRLHHYESPAEIIGQHFTVTQAEVEKANQIFDQAMKGKCLSGLDLPRRCKDGSIGYGTTSISAVFREGRIFGLEGFITDTSDYHRAELALREQERRLRQAHKQESVGKLAARVAHDFNNLLTIINGYSELLLERVESPSPLSKGLADIRSAGEKAAAMTRQLLAFSRKKALPHKALDLNALIADAKEPLVGLLGEGVELALTLDSQLNAVRANADQLNQALMSLAAHSRDAMAGGGSLSIRTENVHFNQPFEDEQELVPPGQYVQLTLSDTGAGMNDEARYQLLAPFFSGAYVDQGGELPLPKAYGFIRQNEGYLLVESAPGKGTTFKILLPAIAEPLTPAKEEEVRSDKRESVETATVLLVEDQEEVRQLASSILKSSGYLVLEAATGEEALRQCTSHSGRIDLIVSDIVMPKMSGVDLVKHLQPGFPNTPVLFMSGYDRDLSDEAYQKVDGSFFISKPFTIQAFIAKVREILTLSQGKRRVLVADDEPAIRNLLSEILEQAGFEVVQAPDGKAAIAEIRNSPVDLVLTDLVMPEKEGLETIQVLRRDFPAIKIIAMSGAFGGEFLNPAKLLGAHATLLKPISRSAVLDTIKNLLN
jgi:two-component system, cell cycle sensor histidine kinase and response regulator CckA